LCITISALNVNKSEAKRQLKLEKHVDEPRKRAKPYPGFMEMILFLCVPPAVLIAFAAWNVAGEKAKDIAATAERANQEMKLIFARSPGFSNGSLNCAMSVSKHVFPRLRYKASGGQTSTTISNIDGGYVQVRGFNDRFTYTESGLGTLTCVRVVTALRSDLWSTVSIGAAAPRKIPTGMFAVVDECRSLSGGEIVLTSSR